MNRTLTNNEIRQAIDVFKYSSVAETDTDVLKLVSADIKFQHLLTAAILEVAEDVSDDIMPSYIDNKGWIICGDERLAKRDVDAILIQVLSSLIHGTEVIFWCPRTPF